MDQVQLQALERDAADFRKQRDARLAAGGLPPQVLASALYAMAAARGPESATHRHLVQAADLISLSSERI